MSDQAASPRLGVPNAPEAITPAWLTAALRSRGLLSDAVVTGVRCEPLNAQGWTTRMARITLVYDRASDAAPASLIAKCSAQDASTRQFFRRFYEREVFFYRAIASHLPLRVPHCYHAHYNQSTGAHVLLLEDLAPAVAGNLSNGVSIDIAGAYTRCIATLHAQWWESPQLDVLLSRFPVRGRRLPMDISNASSAASQ